jgi:hypothetical protein
VVAQPLAQVVVVVPGSQAPLAVLPDADVLAVLVAVEPPASAPPASAPPVGEVIVEPVAPRVLLRLDPALPEVADSAPPSAPESEAIPHPPVTGSVSVSASATIRSRGTDPSDPRRPSAMGAPRRGST